jgi:hypothetical protein
MKRKSEYNEENAETAAIPAKLYLVKDKMVKI